VIAFEDAGDFTEQERWAWVQAKFCQLMAKTLRENLAGRIEKEGHHPSKYQHAYEIAVKADTWEDLGWHLMKPYHIRKENDAYRAQGL
jgi:hypothetical protein